MRGPGVMMWEISVLEASIRLSMSTRSVASMTPVSSPSSSRVLSSSGCRRFSRATLSPTTQVVTRSATRRTASRRGVMSQIQRGRILALTFLEKPTGKVTAMVLGVTSPTSSSRGTMTTMLIQPASSAPNRVSRMAAMLAEEAMLTSSLPQRMEMISRRGSSRRAWMPSEAGSRVLRSFCRWMRLREKRAASEPEKIAEPESRATCRMMRRMSSMSPASIRHAPGAGPGIRRMERAFAPGRGWGSGAGGRWPGWLSPAGRGRHGLKRLTPAGTKFYKGGTGQWMTLIKQ